MGQLVKNELGGGKAALTELPKRLAPLAAELPKRLAPLATELPKRLAPLAAELPMRLAPLAIELPTLRVLLAILDNKDGLAAAIDDISIYP